MSASTHSSMRRMHDWLVTVAFALLTGTAPAVHAQGFNVFNGRNHPELRWQVAETQHFRIVYPAHLAGIEAEAAPIAEASYAALSQNLRVTVDRKIRIYLSDEDEITNGFAVPLGAGHTNIWVRVNDVVWQWTGREKWLRKVIAHELAHIFHYQAIRERPVWLSSLFGDPLPSFWTEGIAQYETEQWDAQRGDRWLRTAVLDDALSYDDGRSLWNGRLRYAVGNAQLRYLTDEMGDSTLATILAQRKPVLFGLAKVHDFGAAFSAVTGESYRSFYDAWRRHVNVYYNTMAGRLERVDSLHAEPLSLPGQYYFDVAYSPDSSSIAVVSLPSLARPVRRLFVVDRANDAVRIVAEGAIQAPVSWSPDGTRIAFARTNRGRHGSLVNDLFVVGRDGRNERRLTHSRRAASPTFSPDGRRLAFSGSDEGTANVFVLNLTTGEEQRLTRYTGDVQIGDVRWHPSADSIAFARFAADGTRDIVLLDATTGDETPITDGLHDDRGPLWSPDGRSIAYSSLRDDVSNVFVVDVATGRHQRVTNLVNGAIVMDWLPPDSLHAEGTLVVSSHVRKSGDEAFRIDARRRADDVNTNVPDAYARWTRHRPPSEIPTTIPPDPSLVQRRHRYQSWRNVTHVASIALPYYAGRGAWGIAGFTSWLEPLAKHTLVLAGNVSLPEPSNSYFVATYVNNQWTPAVTFSGYRLPGSARWYGDDILVEDYAGGDVTAVWPLDWRQRPYATTTFTARLRYVDLHPLDAVSFIDTGVLPPPRDGQQADLSLAYTRSRQRPWRDNVVHPLDGHGYRLSLTAAAPVLGADSRFLRAGVAGYYILPAIDLDRLFVYGRAQAQTGDSFPQDYLGLSRHDDVQLLLPGEVPFTFGDTERVRGYRSYAVGNRMLFGSVEYRTPLLSSLRTRILGLASLGTTTLALFADGGLVWSGADFDHAVRRLGVGAEVKNAARLAFLRFSHALGVAQPADALGSDRRYEVYYRIRAAVPF